MKINPSLFKLRNLGWLLVFAAITLVACNSKTTNEPIALTESESQQYLQKGKEIAALTFSTLSGKLQSALKEGGVSNAIEYCNLAAFPLVDSLSKVHNAEIRRTSSKVRSPKNSPSKSEKLVLENYKKMNLAGAEMKPIIKQLDDQKIAFYAPIKINQFCLQCHGKVGETLTEENNALISQFYPDDQAVGYSDGDLRGMWSIEFAKGNKK